MTAKHLLIILLFKYFIKWEKNYSSTGVPHSGRAGHRHGIPDRTGFAQFKRAAHHQFLHASFVDGPGHHGFIRHSGSQDGNRVTYNSLIVLSSRLYTINWAADWSLFSYSNRFGILGKMLTHSLLDYNKRLHDLINTPCFTAFNLKSIFIWKLSIEKKTRLQCGSISSLFFQEKNHFHYFCSLF